MYQVVKDTVFIYNKNEIIILASELTLSILDIFIDIETFKIFLYLTFSSSKSNPNLIFY